MPSPHRLLAALLLTLSLPSAARADWPHWRGENRNDHVDEPSGWNGEWRLKEKWSTNVGEGCSSPLVVKGRVLATGWRDGQEQLSSIDLRGGKRQWSVRYPCPRYGRHSTGDKGIYAGSVSTPEYDAHTGRLYTLSIDGDLQCWDVQQKAQKLWGFNLYERYGVKRRPDVGGRRSLRDYGYTSSPLVHGESVIVEVGDDQGTVMAYDKRSGRELWKSACRDEAGHSGGLAPMTVDGIPCAAVLTLRNLVVVRLDKEHVGKTLAKFKWTTDFGNNIPTPTVRGNSVIITSAYNHYAMVRLDVTQSGIKKVWQTAEIASGVCSPIIDGDRIYWAWRGVHCLDFNTGKQLWLGGKVGSAGSCVLTSDDRLVVWANQGDLSLVETAKRSPKKYQELAQRKGVMKADAWPHVVMSDGHLLCKDRRGNLKCFAVGE